jgi:toxin ParE1/3/4
MAGGSEGNPDPEVTRELLIGPGAQEDLREAYRWYQSQREGLGEDFLLCVEAALSDIQDHPFRYPILYRDLRRCLIRRFPYGLYYLTEDRGVYLLAALDCRRNPALWKSRLSP